MIVDELPPRGAGDEAEEKNKFLTSVSMRYIRRFSSFLSGGGVGVLLATKQHSNGVQTGVQTGRGSTGIKQNSIRCGVYFFKV